jgi:hypothetical protein
VSKGVLIQLPGFGDRVVLAAGEDNARRNTARMHELLRIFTAEERASLEAYHQGRLFRRKPGEHKSSHRHQQGRQARLLKPWLHDLKQEMKRDPDELAYKRVLRRKGQSYTIDDRVAEWAHELMEAMWATGEMQKKGWSHIPEKASLIDLLKRGGK